MLLEVFQARFRQPAALAQYGYATLPWCPACKRSIWAATCWFDRRGQAAAAALRAMAQRAACRRARYGPPPFLPHRRPNDETVSLLSKLPCSKQGAAAGSARGQQVPRQRLHLLYGEAQVVLEVALLRLAGRAQAWLARGTERQACTLGWG
jgi:hypothetical protein